MLRKLRPYWFEIVLVLVILAFHIYAATAPANNMMNWYSTDDAYYYFKVAQNISEGFGPTFDRIGITNGFHPLWMLICIPIFSLARFDLLLPLRITIVVLALLNAGTAVLIYRLVRSILSKETGMLAAVFWALSLQIHSVTVELGMESGVNVFTVALLAFVVARWEARKGAGYRYRDLAWISGVAILALYARLDNVFLVGTMGLWLLFRTWNMRPVGQPASTSPWMHRLMVALSYGLPVGIALIGYMGFNWLYFGTPMPVSGQIKRWWGTLNNTVYGYPVDNFWVYLSYWFTRNTRFGPWSMLFSAFHNVATRTEKLLDISAKTTANFKWIHRGVVLSLGLIFAGLGYYGIKTNWELVKRAAVRFSLPALFLGCAVQITSYMATTYVNYHDWYWASEMVVIGLALSIVVESLFRMIRRWRVPYPAVQLAVVAISLLMLVRFDRWMAEFVPLVEDPRYYEGYLWGARGLEKATEPGAVIGTTGGGSIAYFIKDRTIVNLDGLINSYPYFQLLKSGNSGAYLDKIGLKYVYGPAYMLMDSEPYTRAFKGKIIYLDSIERTNLYQYMGSNFTLNP